MSETIKAKTTQRLSSRRRVSCPLIQVSLSSLRGTIVPLLLVLLAVLADASYPSVLPPKPLCVPIVEKKQKDAPHEIKEALMELRPFFLLHAQPPKGLMALQAYALSSGPLSHPKVLLLL